MEPIISPSAVIAKYCVRSICHQCEVATKSTMYCPKCTVNACVFCKSQLKNATWAYSYGKEYICLWHLLMQYKYNKAVDKLCRITPLKEKIAQTIIVSCSYQEDYYRQLIHNGLVGGLFLYFKLKNDVEIKECIETLSRYHSEATKFPLLLCADQEGGNEYYTIISDYCGIVTHCPGEIRSKNDKLFSYQSGENSGKLLKILGVQISIAPVVDISSSLGNTDNRYLGTNPYFIAEHARMYIKGLHSQGVYSSIKHLGNYKNSLLPFTLLSDVTDLITVSEKNKEDLQQFRKDSNFEGILINEMPNQNYMIQLQSNFNIIWLSSINDNELNNFTNDVSKSQTYIKLVENNFKKVIKLKFKFTDYCDPNQTRLRNLLQKQNTGA